VVFNVNSGFLLSLLLRHYNLLWLQLVLKFAPPPFDCGLGFELPALLFFKQSLGPIVLVKVLVDLLKFVNLSQLDHFILSFE
jgi:hypothetical protein